MVDLAYAQGPGVPGGGGFTAWLPLILIFLVFYFLLIRPQQRRQKEHQRMIANLRKGDEVITSGGIHGLITNIKENTVMVKVAENVKLEFSKGSIVHIKARKEMAEESKVEPLEGSK